MARGVSCGVLAAVLHSPRLTLRAFRPADAAALATALRVGGARVTRIMPWLTAGRAATLTSLFAELFAEGEEWHYAILCEERLIGGVALQRAGTLLHVGCWLGAAFEGRGYAAEALTRLCREVRERLRAEPKMIVAPTNRRGHRLAERMGFGRSSSVGPDGTTVWEQPS